MNHPKRLPLEGIRVVEFCHVVMGPTCGLVLADMGAEVIKVEPLDGDHTRKLVASGAGPFTTVGPWSSCASRRRRTSGS